MQEFEELARLVDEARKDVDKAMAGQNAAGTRLRGAMQKIKDQAQVIRKKVLEVRAGAQG